MENVDYLFIKNLLFSKYTTEEQQIKLIDPPDQCAIFVLAIFFFPFGYKVSLEQDILVWEYF